MQKRAKIGLRSNLTEEDVRSIRFRVKRGDSRKELAAEYGLSKQSIDNIHLRVTFAHVMDDPEDELAGMAPVDPIAQMEVEEDVQELLRRNKEREEARARIRERFGFGKDRK
jgi:hypothetical protein